MATAMPWRSTAEHQIVRDADGIHLNSDGAALAADVVIEAVRRRLRGS